MRGKHIILAILIGCLLFSATPAHARLFSNNSDSAYNGGDSTNNPKEANLACLSMEDLIIKGAEYFFKAQADINLLSENTEISDLYGVDFFTLWWVVNNALEDINIARYYYRELQYKANSTPYNHVVINKLLNFNYDSFQEQNNLLKDVFSEVKEYLINGDVRGVYSHISTNLDKLMNILETIKGEIENWNIPANTQMWNLNQICAKVHMFGQYVARVFDAIK
jgi:hypothetical protein